jgi:glycosyltransferase involved in cell wall biosynthesis
VRIVHLNPVIRPGGGPAGYLYNLRKFCLKTPSCPIGFAAAAFSESRQLVVAQSGIVRLIQKARKLIPGRVFAGLLLIKAWADRRRSVGSALAAQLDGSGAVVSHDFRLFLRFLNWRRKSAGRPMAVLMLHSPTNPTQEMAFGWGTGYQLGRELEPVRRVWAKMELDAIRSADAIILPNRHAVDGYFPGDPDRLKLLLSRPIIEIPSGVPPLRSSRPRDAVRAELGVAPDEIAIGYLGRKVPDKGYDIFVEAARMAAHEPRHSKLRFIGIGAGYLHEPSPPANMTQLGWRSDAGDLMSAFDVLMVPNRIAYFDLGILEALSAGKTVYTTHVGGSKGLVSGAVKYLFASEPAEIAAEFLEMLGGPDPFLDPAQILQIYEEHYSSGKFFERHLQLADELSRLDAAC